MTIKRIKKGDYLCVICDGDATCEVSNNGSLKLFWACSPEDAEITLCDACRHEMTAKLAEVAKSLGEDF